MDILNLSKVLQGAVFTILKYKPKIFLSVHPDLINSIGDSISDLNEIIYKINYSINEIDGTSFRGFINSEYLLLPK